jgi:general L-amino acid transport system ATP-binding protein
MNQPSASALIAPYPAISIHEMQKWYGDFHVLKGIDLHISSGEIVVVCGPSGSGKSTLIRCLNLLEDFQKGKVFIDGIELTRNAACVASIRRQVGMVFQQFNLFPHMTVLENLMLGPRLVSRLDESQARQLAYEYLDQCGSGTRRTSTPASSPAVSSNALPSPGPLHATTHLAVRRTHLGT